MSPILGIYASQMSGHLWPASSYESISTVNGGGSSVSFTSIPSTYSHLQLRVLTTSTRASNEQDYYRVRFNSDTGTNYAAHVLEGYGTGAGSFATTTTASPYTFIAGGGTAGTNVFGAAVIDILDYANTNKYKTTRAISGIDTNTNASRVWLSSSVWLNSSAISSLTISSVYGGTISSTSSFALYGIKGVA